MANPVASLIVKSATGLFLDAILLNELQPLYDLDD